MEAAIDAIADWSKGIPRLINAICDNALLIAFSDEMDTVEVRHIREACKELDLPVSQLRPQIDPSASDSDSHRKSPDPEPQVPFTSSYEPQLLMEERPSMLKRWMGMGPKEKQ